MKRLYETGVPINKPRISNRKAQALFIADQLRISSVLAYTKTVNSWIGVNPS